MAPKSTGAILKRLRSLMTSAKHVPEPLHAYIVPTDDAHQSEYISDHDKRREFLTGFSGSAGTAVVTLEKAALWTDGRYHLQAEAQLDANWTLMKDGLKGTLTQADWLCKVLPSEARVGVDPYVLAQAQWEPLSKKLSGDGHKLVGVEHNLIDLVWDDQPDPPHNPVFVQPFKYAGQTWEDKVKILRKKLEEKNCYGLVVSALDEVAWLLNLRGSDIEFNPCFMSYIILTMDSVLLFMEEKKLTDDAKKHLNCSSDIRITIKPYEDILNSLKAIAEKTDKKIWVSNKSSSAVYNAIPNRKRFSEYSVVDELKAIKNKVEIEGMRNSHIRDSVALCEYFLWLEKEVPNGGVTEISGSDKLEKLRRSQADFVSLSFDTISGSGGHGAIIHYKATEESNKPISMEELYLCDSGAQYKDGTTDVTRTIHLGTPTHYQQECFTHVLKGHICLGTLIWPNNVKGHMIDSFARASLWNSGLDYVHGTGHGVGSFLNVHEGPCSIHCRPRPGEVPLAEGMIMSDEPGFYEDGEFGVRIESLVLIVKSERKYNYKKKGFLTFEPITLVPIQRKMILPELLTEAEISWLNDYHQKCRDVIGQELKAQNKLDVLDWLMKETQPIG